MKKWNWLIVLLLPLSALAQLTDLRGLIPQQQMQFERSGIWANNLECWVGDEQWISQRLPANQAFKLVLLEPKGLKADAQGRVFPLFSALITTRTGDTLLWQPRLLEALPIALHGGQLKKLSLEFMLGNLAKKGDSLHLRLGFHDSLSQRFFQVQFPVNVVDSFRRTDFAQSIQTHSSTRGYRAMLDQLTCSRFETYLDSGYFPKSMYHSVRAAEIKGVSLDELQRGQVSAWLYDEQLKPVKLIKAVKWYAAKTQATGETSNLLIQIPLDPQEPKNRSYSIRARWQAASGGPWLEVINRF